MGRYIARRIIMMMPVLIGTTLLIYAAVFLLPGNPVAALAGANRALPLSIQNAIEAKYHLNEPFFLQYWHYLTGLFRGQFGVDLNGQNVSAIISAAWPVTLKLALTAWMIGSVVGVVLGLIAGVNAGKTADSLVLGGSTLVLGIPYFIIAYVAQIVIGVKLGWLPVSGIANGWPASYLVPASCLALFGLPEVSRLTRAAVMENLRSDYVDTAVTKGLGRQRILIRHVLRNSMVPVSSMLGINLGYLLGGTILIEGIFNLPGLGYQIYQGVQQHNGPVVVGISTLLVLAFLVVNLVVDVMYGVLDPRIRVA
jgi:oligopeptide transport system permease protein